MRTYQDFEAALGSEKETLSFIDGLIGEHAGSEAVCTAKVADEYLAQQNRTIMQFTKVLYTLTGRPVEDFTASNNKIASNFFHNFNVRRCAYSLGNGVDFSDAGVKEKLGLRFDTTLQDAALMALVHGRSFMFFNAGRVHVFKLTEFVPLEDELTGELRAGVRFWQIAKDKPLCATLYEEDGYTELRKTKERGMYVASKKRPYLQEVRKAPADEEAEIVGGRNYHGKLPIIQMWGSRLHQSTLVGMRGAIDAYDMIRSGFANDLEDCAQIYWVLENYNGMSNDDLAKFRDRLKFTHIASVDTGDGGKVTSHTQEVPHAARTAFLSELRAGMYEDFGLMDMKTLSAAATNDHIDAGYQAQDDMADDFEYQIIDAVQQLLALIGIEDTPRFKRGRVSNRKELIELLAMENDMVPMPEEVLLSQFPNLTPEDVKMVLDTLADMEVKRYTAKTTQKREEVIVDE